MKYDEREANWSRGLKSEGGRRIQEKCFAVVKDMKGLKKEEKKKKSGQNHKRRQNSEAGAAMSDRTRGKEEEEERLCFTLRERDKYERSVTL